MNLGKNNLAQIEVVLEVLTPQDSGTAPIIIGGVVDDTGTPGQSQTITFAALGSKSIGSSPLTLSATASSGLPVTYMSTDPAKAKVYDGNKLELLEAGTVSIIATQPGNSVYAAAPPVVSALTITV